MRVWVHQDSKQVAKRGEDLASWYASWVDPDGKRVCKSCGPGKAGRSAATKLAERTSAQLLTGQYGDRTKKTWKDFIDDYTEKVLESMKPGSRSARETALKHFKRLARPMRVKSLDTKMVDTYIAARKVDRPGISPATINHELREIRAVARKAVKWGELDRSPEFNFLKEPKKLTTYLTPEHFAAVYQAAGNTTEPANLPYPAADWWRGLLVMAYMTGWRIGSLLSMRWEDVDLTKATALSRAEHNKGGRDQFISLDPVVIQHLSKLQTFLSPVVFPSEYRRGLYDMWHALQDAAGVVREDGKRYGFHDIRRAFATMNHERVSPADLQSLMQHKDAATTARYIRGAIERKPKSHDIYVPGCLALA